MLNTMMKLCVLFTFLSLVRSEPPSTDYGTPLGAPLSSYGTPNYHEQQDGNNHHDHGEPKSYEFGYQVKDDYTGTNYNRKESSDGNQVRGEYRVALPDGRTQIVTYWADWQNGFHADVRYEGEAHYPDQYNKAGQGYNDGGYNNGGYNQGANNQYGASGYNNGYTASSTNSLAINNLAAGQDNYNYNSNNNNYDSYNSGYNKAPPSTVYGPA